jgi:hypothetical protein
VNHITDVCLLFMQRVVEVENQFLYIQIMCIITSNLSRYHTMTREQNLRTLHSLLPKMKSQDHHPTTYTIKTHLKRNHIPNDATPG